MIRSKLVAQLSGPAVAAMVWWIANEQGLPDEATRVLAATSWMLVWWIAEAVPLGVTSVMPMVLFPVMGISSIAETTAPYGSHYVFLFMGGFLIALALERWDLHKRFALSVLVLAGGNPRLLIAGFMTATAVLSMWISNTATTLMMLPIALSVLHKVDPKIHPNFALALLLGTAYSANLGGVATLIGTPPNVAMAGVLENQFNIEVPFLEWTLMALPFSMLMLCVVYILLTRVLTPVAKGSLSEGRNEIRNELLDLGPWRQAECRVAAVFAVTGFLWVGRRWLVDWSGIEMSDTSIAMAAGISLFLIPSANRHSERLLAWKDTRNLPWDILLLFGGGLTLAKALAEAEVLTMVAQAMAAWEGVSHGLLILLFAGVALLLTEVMSNLALTVVMVPIVGQIALEWGANPMLLVIPVTIASSCAFMLPMATPPNAIIFGSQRITMKEMASVGLVLNVIAAVLAWLWGIWVLPWWLQFL
ncbi:MAG: anion transporter [Crocinitomicaceae bacterium]|nr:anion transporter [Crocinitomicaceae bacterium]